MVERRWRKLADGIKEACKTRRKARFVFYGAGIVASIIEYSMIVLSVA